MEKWITGHTGLLALIGSPVEHSGSPAMHNYSFKRLGLDYVYVALDVKEKDVKQAIEAVRLFRMRGINVTMPNKSEAAKYVDELSPAARLIGAVNTIVNEDGKLIGHITDGIGFVDNLKDHGVSIKDKKVTIAGAGGTALAIIVQCALDGAKEIVVLKRKNASFEAVVQKAKEIETEVLGCSIKVCDINDGDAFKKEVQTSDIFVNATNVGMKPNDEQSIITDDSVFHKNLVVADVIYNPLETKLLKDAKAAGCRCVGGKGMLLWQGVAAFRLFTGRDMPVEEVKEKFFS